jgi:hypothetical protein
LSLPTGKPPSMSLTSEPEVTEVDWSTNHPVIVPASAGKGNGGAPAPGAGGISGAGPPAAPCGAAAAIVVSSRLDRSNLGNYGWIAAARRIRFLCRCKDFLDSTPDGRADYPWSCSD